LGLPQALQDYDAESYARRASNVSYDQTPFLEEIEPPLLCVFGENDINVSTAKSVAALERITREFERDITFKVYPDVGHSLFSVKGIFTAGFTGDYLDLIGNWARDHTAAK
ncbi:MAG: prolyl oligopeptidase family serine peptidase, partial [Candidatus Hydrogenedentota bacterium]